MDTDIIVPILIILGMGIAGAAYIVYYDSVIGANYKKLDETIPNMSCPELIIVLSTSRELRQHDMSFNSSYDVTIGIWKDTFKKRGC